MTADTSPALDPKTWAELRRLHEAATPGPWCVEDDGLTICGYGDVISRDEDDPDLVIEAGIASLHDMSLIATMRNALSALLDAAERAERLEQQLASMDRETFEQMSDAEASLEREVANGLRLERENEKLRERLSEGIANVESGGTYHAQVEWLSRARALSLRGQTMSSGLFLNKGSLLAGMRVLRPEPRSIHPSEAQRLALDAADDLDASERDTTPTSKRRRRRMAARARKET